MARAAAATALMNRELGSLSKDSVRTKRSMSDIDDGIVRVGSHAEKSGSQIDKLSGRVRILADVAAILGPSLVPIGGVGIAAIAGLASEFGFAAIGAGTAILAFQGVGDALKAVNKAAIQPTAANLDAARVAMDKLGPSGREFVSALRQVIPQLKQLQVAAADGLLPGAAEGLQSIVNVLPRLEGIVSAVSNELGNIAADTGKALSSDEWEPFLKFIEAEAPKALADMAHIAGNSAHALADLWMAFTPIDNGFSQFLVDSSADIETWAAGLEKTQGFQDFVAYIQDTGPKVADALGAIANATIQIVEAAAPLGGPVLQGVTALFNAVAGIANSDLGTPIFAGLAALALMNRTIAITDSLQKATFGGPAVARIKGQTAALSTLTAEWRAYSAVNLTVAGRALATTTELQAAERAAQSLGGRLRTIGKGVGVIGGLAVASTGAADGIGLTNTASGLLLGTMAGAPGVVAGGLIGAFLDARDASAQFGDAVKQADRDLQNNAGLTKLTADLNKLQQQQKQLQPSDGFSVKNIPQNLLQGVSHPFGLFGGTDLSQNQKAQAQIKFFGTLQDAITQVASAEDFANEGFRATQTGLDNATQSAQDFQKAIEDVNAVLTGRSTFRDFEQSIDDFTARQKKRIELQKELADAIKAQQKSGATPSQQNRINNLQDTIENGKTAKDRAKARGSLAALEATIANKESADRKRATEDVKRLREELATYKKTLDTTTQAGRDNAEALDNIATSALNYANTIKDPVLRSAFLDNARGEFIKAARAAGATAQGAKDLATQVGLLDGVKGKVKITVDANGVVKVIDEVQAALDRLARKGNLKLNITAGENRRNAQDRPFWSGGFTGSGGKFEPAGIVHRGEVVIPEHLVKRDWSMLRSRYGHLPGFANGGLVQPFASSVSNTWNSNVGPSIDYNRLAQALAAVRPPQPLYGDVHVHGDGSFRRALETDKRRSAMDGVSR